MSALESIQPSVYEFELPEPTEAHLEHLLDLRTIQPSVN